MNMILMRLFFVFSFMMSLAMYTVPVLHAQSITGLWGIKEVTIGEKEVTPVAKWTRINKDGTFQSGNGYLQNAEGSWVYDRDSKSYLPKETNGIIDPYGAFTVTVDRDNMTWTRHEDGMPLVVKLERIEKLPKSTADVLVGLWSLKDVVRNGMSEIEAFDPNHKHYIFIRWDRVYIERSPQGEKGGGYWHINGHRPDVTFIRNDLKDAETWSVSVSESELTMVGISESNKEVVRHYKRLNDFPQ